MTLKDLLHKSKNHLEFWELLERAGGRLLFEEYVANYLKATLPGETYWLGEDVVPPSVAEKYNFSSILKGKRSLAADIINIYQNRAVGYESKWLDDKETINLKRVSDKLQVIKNTGIDQLIFATNARKPSGAIDEWASEAGFIFLEGWINKEVYETVKQFINSKKKKKYIPITPRDDFFKESLEQLGKDYSVWVDTHLGDLAVRIFQHWPAASGKGSFPRLAYDLLFEPNWDFKKGCPINVIESPNLTVLKGNLTKNVEHDLGLGNNNVHIVFAGDVTRAAKDSQELQTLRAQAKVFTKKIEYLEFVKENKDKTIWVHVTPHSYSLLADMMRALKRSFYFGHIDEVHHLIQPDWSSWTASLDDQSCKIQIRLMTSANRRLSNGNGSTYSMEDSKFCDIKVRELTENMAVKLGYKRQCEIVNYIYDEKCFNDECLEEIKDGLLPLYRLKGTKLVVPLHWFAAADALFSFRTDHTNINHTKLTVNFIENCIKFKEFLTAIRPKLLLEYCGSKENPVYQRLMKAKIMVADTHKNSTVKILKEVSSIPDLHEDSFLIHDRLLGEGWDPVNGWLDSTLFVDPIGSEIRIYQDYNRASRIGDGSKKTNYLILTHFKDPENNFNKMFGCIKRVGEVLQIGDDEILERIQLKSFKRLPRGMKGTKAIGSDTPTYYGDLAADFFKNAFVGYLKTGKWYAYGSLIHDIVRDFIKEITECHLDTIRYGSTLRHGMVKRDFIMFNLIAKYKEFFDQYAPNGRMKKFYDFIRGQDHRLSSDLLIEILERKEKNTKKSKYQLKLLYDKVVDLEDNTNLSWEEIDNELEKFYIQHYGKPREVILSTEAIKLIKDGYFGLNAGTYEFYKKQTDVDRFLDTSEGIKFYFERQKKHLNGDKSVDFLDCKTYDTI